MFTKKRPMLIALILLLSILSGYAKVYNPGDVFKSIKNKKLIKIGISKHYPPLNFSKGSKGLEVELSKQLAGFLGVRVKIIPLAISNYINAITTGKVDIVIAGLSKNLERGKNIWFSIPYITATPAVLVNKRKLPQTNFGETFEKRPFRTIWDLKKLNRFTFAVKKKSSYESLLKNRLPNMKRTLITSNNQGIRLLKRGRVHGFVHDSLYLQYLYRTSASLRSNYILLQGGKQKEEICIGLPMGDTILKVQIDLFISEMLRQGHVNKWLKNYNK